MSTLVLGANVFVVSNQRIFGKLKKYYECNNIYSKVLLCKPPGLPLPRDTKFLFRMPVDLTLSSTSAEAAVSTAMSTATKRSSEPLLI
jgi:hypothetical protein